MVHIQLCRAAALAYCRILQQTLQSRNLMVTMTPHTLYIYVSKLSDPLFPILALFTKNRWSQYGAISDHLAGEFSSHGRV